MFYTILFLAILQINIAWSMWIPAEETSNIYHNQLKIPHPQQYDSVVQIVPDQISHINPYFNINYKQNNKYSSAIPVVENFVPIYDQNSIEYGPVITEIENFVPNYIPNNNEYTTVITEIEDFVPDYIPNNEYPTETLHIENVDNKNPLIMNSNYLKTVKGPILKVTGQDSKNINTNWKIPNSSCACATNKNGKLQKGDQSMIIPSLSTDITDVIQPCDVHNILKGKLTELKNNNINSVEEDIDLLKASIEMLGKEIENCEHSAEFETNDFVITPEKKLEQEIDLFLDYLITSTKSPSPKISQTERPYPEEDYYYTESKEDSGKHFVIGSGEELETYTPGKHINEFAPKLKINTQIQKPGQPLEKKSTLTFTTERPEPYFDVITERPGYSVQTKPSGKLLIKYIQRPTVVETKRPPVFYDTNTETPIRPTVQPSIFVKNTERPAFFLDTTEKSKRPTVMTGKFKNMEPGKFMLKNVERPTVVRTERPALSWELNTVSKRPSQFENELEQTYFTTSKPVRHKSAVAYLKTKNNKINNIELIAEIFKKDPKHRTVEENELLNSFILPVNSLSEQAQRYLEKKKKHILSVVVIPEKDIQEMDQVFDELKSQHKNLEHHVQIVEDNIYTLSVALKSQIIFSAIRILEKLDQNRVSFQEIYSLFDMIPAHYLDYDDKLFSMNPYKSETTDDISVFDSLKELRTKIQDMEHRTINNANSIKQILNIIVIRIQNAPTSTELAQKLA